MAGEKKVVDPTLSEFYEAMERTNAEKIAHETLDGISESSSDDESFDAESENEDAEDRPWRPSHTVFEKSTIKQSQIDSMKGRYFHDISIVRAGGDNNTPVPEADEVVVYRSFMKAGLRFPLDNFLVEVLKTFEIYLHQITPEAIIRMGIFIWAMRSQGLEPNARVHRHRSFQTGPMPSSPLLSLAQLEFAVIVHVVPAPSFDCGELAPFLSPSLSSLPFCHARCGARSPLPEPGRTGPDRRRASPMAVPRPALRPCPSVARGLRGLPAVRGRCGSPVRATLRLLVPWRDTSRCFVATVAPSAPSDLHGPATGRLLTLPISCAMVSDSHACVASQQRRSRTVCCAGRGHMTLVHVRSARAQLVVACVICGIHVSLYAHTIIVRHASKLR
jgi:hypothetical protein